MTGEPQTNRYNKTSTPPLGSTSGTLSAFNHSYSNIGPTSPLNNSLKSKQMKSPSSSSLNISISKDSANQQHQYQQQQQTGINF
jgi:hypothetical protein